MRFSLSGNVLACCFNREVILGRFPDDRLHDIWFGTRVRELRKRLENNDLSMGCYECSRRLNQGFFQLSGAMQYDYLAGHKKSKYPTMLDFELSNNCNLECIMCTGENSSSIRNNREKGPAYKQHYNHDFVTQLDEFIPWLHEARFSGGEPFLVPLYYDIWKKIIKVNSKTEISILTNASVLNQEIIELLQNGIFKISVSVDSLRKETLETIRRRSCFETIMKNLEFFIKYSKSAKKNFSLNVCIMPYNWKELPEILEFCNDNAINLVFHTVLFPPAHSLSTLSSEGLKEIKAYLNKSFSIDRFGKSSHNEIAYNQVILQVEAWVKEAQIREEMSKVYENKSEKELLDLLSLHLNASDPDSRDRIFSMIEATALPEASRKKIITNLLGFSPLLINAELRHNETEKIKERLQMFNY